MALYEGLEAGFLLKIFGVRETGWRDEYVDMDGRRRNGSGIRQKSSAS